MDNKEITALATHLDRSARTSDEIITPETLRIAAYHLRTLLADREIAEVAYKKLKEVTESVAQSRRESDLDTQEFIQRLKKEVNEAAGCTVYLSALPGRI